MPGQDHKLRPPCTEFLSTGCARYEFSRTHRCRDRPNTCRAPNSGLAPELTTCVCGRQCKGRRGLAAHQRTCRSFRDLSSDQCQNVNSVILDVDGKEELANEPQDLTTESNHPNRQPEKLLAGRKLPKAKNDWYVANSYLHIYFTDLLKGDDQTDPEGDVISFQESIYGYFEQEYGTLNVKSNTQFDEKYNSLSIKSLKKSLHVLKSKGDHGDTEEIKFLSKLIREALRAKTLLVQYP